MNAPLLVALGALVGFISGLFGIGGGFLMTPVLVFLGIPPAVAVASMSNHVAASSMSSVISYSRRRSVDFRMGGVLAGGGVVGAVVGVEIFRWLRLIGQADLVVALAYLIFLGVIGGLMLWESLGAILRRRRNAPAPPRKDRRPPWLYGLPLKLRFPRSRLYISVIPPILLGAFVGVLSAIMGVGGGFILVPAMVYLLRMRAAVVVGTSLFQIIITTALTGVSAGRPQPDRRHRAGRAFAGRRRAGRPVRGARLHPLPRRGVARNPGLHCPDGRPAHGPWPLLHAA